MMNYQRLEITARSALELAQQLSDTKVVEFVDVLQKLGADTPHAITLRCNGGICVEIDVFGDNGGIKVFMDEELIDSFENGIWIREIGGLGKGKHVLSLSTDVGATDVRIRVTAKGVLRI